MKDLMNLLNAYDFKAFPQKNDPKKVTLSVACNDNNRYFVTSVNAGTPEKPIWKWGAGAKMQKMNVENKDVEDLGPAQ